MSFSALFLSSASYCVAYRYFCTYVRGAHTVLFMVWAGLSCLNMFINSIVWNGNIINWAHVWCDISTKFVIGASAAIPATSLCITHHLYLLSHASHATFNKREKRNQLIFNLGVGIGIPILQMVLQYVVQDHRFDIYEDIGCYPVSSAVPIGIPIIYGIPFLTGLVSATYGFLTIRTLRKSHRKFKDVVQRSADSNVNASHYIRLMLLAAVDIVGELTLNLCYLLMNTRGGMIHSWISWADTHRGFSRVDQFPVIVWRSWGIEAIGTDATRWIYVTCAFLFFGFSQECMDQYRSVLVWLRTKAGFRPPSETACTVNAPLPQMKFKTTSSTGSDGFLSSTHQTNIVTLPEPALMRSEFKSDLDVGSSLGEESHLTNFTPSSADALSNV